jgi:serine/threonine-protein kinase HipA
MESNLDVYCCNSKVGRISYHEESEKFILQYDPSWVEHGFALSPHLPKTGVVDSKAIRNFIDNLLPEGEGLEFISRFFQISKANKFSLMGATGTETAGALVFISSNTPLPVTSFRPISNDELENRIAKRDQTSINIWDGKVRLSLAGVQDKLPLVVTKNGFGIGEGSVASTHILKFGKNRTQHIVLNEYLCMQLGAHIGLNIAPTEIRRFNDEPVLFVKRFDRVLTQEEDEIGFSVKRLHIIDGCQLLNLPHSYKYERAFGGDNKARVGVSMKQLFSSIPQFGMKIDAKRDLLRWAIFNMFISNYDAHGKNISFYITEQGVNVAPLYDLVNIALYKEFTHEYAMAIGDAFDPKDLNAYEIAYFCYLINVKPRLFVTEASTLGKTLLSNINEIFNTVNCINDDELEFVKKLQIHIVETTQKIFETLPLVSQAYKDHLDEFIEIAN